MSPLFPREEVGNTGLSAGVLGIIIGVAVLAAIGLFWCCMMYVRRRQGQGQGDEKGSRSYNSGAYGYYGGGDYTGNGQHHGGGHHGGGHHGGGHNGGGHNGGGGDGGNGGY